MLKEDGDKKFVNVMLNSGDYAVLQAKAKEQERSVSALCRLILKDYITNARKEGILEDKKDLVVAK